MNLSADLLDKVLFAKGPFKILTLTVTKREKPDTKQY